MSMRTWMCVALVAAMGWVNVNMANTGELSVKLTVREDAGVARVNEPVTTGVPFPHGLVKDVSKLALVDAAGKPVPAAFTATCLWPQDKSVRWALLDTQVSVPAKGTAEFTVVSGTPARPSAKLEAEDMMGGLIVRTGPVILSVGKAGFRLFNEAVYGAYGALVRRLSPTDGLTMTIDGVRYTSANDKTSKVVIEEQNPMRVCLLATGKLTTADGKTGYDYEVRIHAYAGQWFVTVVPTIIKKFGARRDVNHTFSDLSLEFKLANATGLKFALGGEGAPATGDLKADQKAYVVVKDSDHWTFGGAAKGEGDPKKTKPLSLGWGALTGGNGIAVGVREFWQVFPKAIELGGDGTVKVGLMPALAGKPQEFYTGMARTHEVRVEFTTGEKPEELQNRFVAFQRPLVLAATPEWYCSSGALGTLASAGAKLAGNGTDEFKKFDERISGYFDQLIGQRRDEWKGRRGVTMDAYGWLAFGDTLHWVWDEEPDVKSPWAVAWDSNYYDLPHIACHYFARTGDRKYFEYFADHTWHLMDIDVIHWDPEFKQGGTSRRCPATNHVGFDPPDHREPIVNAAYDHHKSESVWERYYLTGDRRALEVAQDLLGHAFRFDIPENQMAGRRVGHRLSTLVMGYWHTGDKKYLDKGKKTVDLELKRMDANQGWHAAKVDFTCGISMEGLAKYYEATGDKTVLDALKRAADWLLADPKRQSYSNLSFFVAEVYRQTGDDKYRDLALKLIWVGKPGHLSKDMGAMYRNVSNVTGCLLPTGR